MDKKQANWDRYQTTLQMTRDGVGQLDRAIQEMRAIFQEERAAQTKETLKSSGALREQVASLDRYIENADTQIEKYEAFESELESAIDIDAKDFETSETFYKAVINRIQLLQANEELVKRGRPPQPVNKEDRDARGKALYEICEKIERLRAPTTLTWGDWKQLEEGARNYYRAVAEQFGKYLTGELPVKAPMPIPVPTKPAPSTGKRVLNKWLGKGTVQYRDSSVAYVEWDNGTYGHIPVKDLEFIDV